MRPLIFVETTFAIFAALLAAFSICLFQPDLSPAVEAQALRLSGVHHNLSVALHPEDGSLSAEDTVTVPSRLLPRFRFFLHKGLHLSPASAEVSIVKEGGKDGDIFDSYRVILPKGIDTFQLKYGGVIHHELMEHGSEHAGGYRTTIGIISGEGVFLVGNSFWYPVIENEFVHFTLAVKLPSGWGAISQGKRTALTKNGETQVTWVSGQPQEEIVLSAAKFHEYARPAGRIEAMAFLRKPDKELAEKYLQATADYISLYERLLGPYPYEKFAVVENFWETGFGLPSFTLLGPKVIRFPFIIDTSYPHEILHNWWGNGVFPDYRGGNWSEGLTAYLSDYLLKEKKGEAMEYRRSALQKYANYVRGEKDFALSEFRSRHSSSSEAIGYGKSLMFFHMLRLQLGDGYFIQGLKSFYMKNRFGFASFRDIRKSFEAVSGRNLEKEFEQWVSRPGAPELEVSNVNAKQQGSQYLLTATIEQVQSGDPYIIRIPIAVTLEGRAKTFQSMVALNGKRGEFRMKSDAKPLRLDLDPEFDVFRRVDRSELPPSISETFGAEKILVVIPSDATEGLRNAYRKFAESIKAFGPGEINIHPDSDAPDLSGDYPLVILGWENRYLDRIGKVLSDSAVSLANSKIVIGQNDYPLQNNSFVFAAREPNSGRSMLFIGAIAEAMDGLSRKVPHYSKYSYLVFGGREPTNVAKGTWAISDSPLTKFISYGEEPAAQVPMGLLEKRKSLADFAGDK